MEPLLDVKQVSKVLAVSENTIWKWVITRRIPFIKVGFLVRFKESDIKAILERGLK